MALEKPRISYVIQSYPPYVGGAELQAHRVAQLLAADFTVDVVTGKNAGRPRHENLDGVRVHRVWQTAGTNTRKAAVDAAILGVGAAMLTHPHLVQGFQLNNATVAAACTAILRRVPLIIKITSRSNFEINVGWRRETQMRWLFRQADLIVAPSLALYDLALQRGAPADKLHYIPNGVDTAHFAPVPLDRRAAARAELGFPHDAFVFLWLGRLAPVKRLHLLLDAWGHVVQARPQSRLLVVGDGEDDTVVRELVGRYPQSVRREHFWRDVRPLHHAADSLIVTTRGEGLSNGLLEALSSGLPVVASDVPENVEVGDGEEFLRLFHTNGPDAMVQAMIAAVDAAPARERLGAAARARVESAYSLAATAIRWSALYRQLLSPPACRPVCSFPG